MALEQTSDILSLGFDYGQRHRIELEYADRQCKRFGVPRKIIRMEWDKPPRQMPRDRAIEQIRQGGVSPAFLPGRNLVFLALGTAQAAGIGAAEVWIGVNSVDFSGYPDCREEFVQKFSAAAECGITKAPRIVAPLQNLSKPQIAGRAHRAGLGFSDTWSCYRPEAGPNGPVPCNSCDACKFHTFAWKDIA